MHHEPVPNPRSLPGLVQVVLAVALMVALWLLVAAALGLPDGWDAFVGIFAGSLLLALSLGVRRPPVLAEPRR